MSNKTEYFTIYTHGHKYNINDIETLNLLLEVNLTKVQDLTINAIKEEAELVEREYDIITGKGN